MAAPILADAIPGARFGLVVETGCRYARPLSYPQPVDIGLAVERVNKVAQGRPHIVDRIKDGEVALIFNTTEGWQSLKDSKAIRESALQQKIPYFTTASASVEAAKAIAVAAREENQSLKARLDALEARPQPVRRESSARNSHSGMVESLKAT